MGFVVQAVESEVVAPLPVVERGGERWLELGPTVAELPRESVDEGWRQPMDGPVAGVKSGDQWTALGDDGSRATCTVSGFERRAASAEGYGSAEDATCGGWVAFAKLACDGASSPAPGIAVPGHASPARSFAAEPASGEDLWRARVALAASPAWAARLAEIGAASGQPSVDVKVRAFGPWRVAEADVWTGAGEGGCGGAEELERWLVVLDAGGGVVWAPRAAPDPWVRESPSVEGVYDLRNDGVPELRLVRPLVEVDLVDREGRVHVHQPVHFCGCPC